MSLTLRAELQYNNFTFRRYSGLQIYTCNKLFIFHLTAFLCCLEGRAVFWSDSFVTSFFFLFLWSIFCWLQPSPFMFPVDACREAGKRSLTGQSLLVLNKLSETWVSLWTALVWASGSFCEMLCSSLARVGWLGQGRTSQSKCIWGGIWERVWVWDIPEEEGTPAVRKRGGLGAGAPRLWASVVSAWEEVMCGWASLSEKRGGWELCCCRKLHNKDYNHAILCLT